MTKGDRTDRRREKALEGFLVAASRTGDQTAMAGLIRLRGPRLLAHATRLLGDAEVARDMVQEAWVEILRGLNGLRDDAAFLPWALRIVSRRISREIARRQRARQLQRDYALEADPHSDVDPAGPVDAAIVRRAIAGLSPAHRATIALFYLEEMSVAEVADATDVPVGTVKTRLMHARAQLKRALEGEQNEQD